MSGSSPLGDTRKPGSSPLSFLSENDFGVLNKILDPESDPFAQNAPVDKSLPADPHVTDAAEYQEVTREEGQIVKALNDAEKDMAVESGQWSASTRAPRPSWWMPRRVDETMAKFTDEFQACLFRLDTLVAAHPSYASARNNRAQLLRQLYGDALVVVERRDPVWEHRQASQSSTSWPVAAGMIPVPPSPDDDEAELEHARAAATILSDLAAAIELLTPATPQTPVSPQAARTLASAHTQRGAVYLATARLLRAREQRERDLQLQQAAPERRRDVGMEGLLGMLASQQAAATAGSRSGATSQPQPQGPILPPVLYRLQQLQQLQKRYRKGGDNSEEPLTALPEASWTRPADFDEAAAADFAAGARFGSQLARRLAVPANPTAKLCGHMVREAMRREYGDSFVDGSDKQGEDR